MNIVPFGDWSEKDRMRDLMSRRWHQRRQEKALSVKEQLWVRWLLEDVE